ncbi:MAG: flagellar export chaperone FliS [Oscillospiraceae bacterium]
MLNSYQKYQEQSVATMTQGELLIKLYDTCSKRLSQGVLFIEEKNPQKANEVLQKAQNILHHLDATLDRSYAISANLSALYDFFIRQIIHANVRKDAEALQEIIPMIDALRDTFREAEKIVHKNRA